MNKWKRDNSNSLIPLDSVAAQLSVIHTQQKKQHTKTNFKITNAHIVRDWWRFPTQSVKGLIRIEHELFMRGRTIHRVDHCQ